jgi:hypothetical protein
MPEYKVIAKAVSTFIWRDVQKAVEELSAEVNAEIPAGWEPHGGIASVQAGAGVYVLQALVKR